jgi:hypothetical protein
MKIAVITSIVDLEGGTVQDPRQKFSGVDYYAIVDRPQNTQYWQQIPAIKFSSDPQYSGRRNAKLAKVLGWLLVPGYDYYIWHDNHCEVCTDPKVIAAQYLQLSEIALFKHAHRNCAYAELQKVTEIQVDAVDNFSGALEFLQREQYPLDNGLFEMTSFMYRLTPKVKAMMLTWWELIARYTSRDQVMFPYALNKHQVSYSILPGAALGYGGNNQFFPSIRWKHS